MSSKITIYCVLTMSSPNNLRVAHTLLLYILTIFSLRRVSIFSFTSLLSCSRCRAKSFEGVRAGPGIVPENLSLPDSPSFLFTSTYCVISGGLLTVWRESAETRWPSSSSTQRRLATEKGEVKERLDLFSLSLREALSFW